MIKVVIDKSLNCNPLLSKKSAYLTFNYKESIVNYLKALRYKSYDPKTHTWEIQEKDLLEFCKVWGRIDQINIIDIYKEDVIDTSDFKVKIPEDYKFYLEPLKFQREGIEWGLNHPSFLLADEPGLGKTLSSLNITNIECKNKVLVICCSSSIKYNWINEIQKTINQQGYILGKNGKGGGKDRLNDLENIDNIPQKYIITNIETISLLKEKKGRSWIYPIANKINELCAQGKIEGIIIDESHLALKGHTTHSAKALLKIKDCKYKIAMTGTPVVNTPLDVFVILRWLNILGDKADYWMFSHTFGVFDSWGHRIGYKNINHLAELLKNSMLRRERKGNIDLPERMIIDEYIEMGDKQKRLYKAYTKDYLKHIIQKVSSEEPLGTLTDLRKITAFPHLVDPSLFIKDSMKLSRLKELLEELTINNKIVIFSNWTTVTKILKEELSIYNPAYITGEVSNEDRQKEVDRFQTDPTCKICIGSIGAMGVGLTLTAGSIAIFYDEPWNQATYDQCADRIYRIGQKNNVVVYNLMCKGTIDEKIHDLIRGKGEFADYMVDGTLKQNIDNKLLLEALANDETLEA